MVKEISLNQRKLLSKYGLRNKKMWKLIALAPKIPLGHITSHATLNVQKGNLHWDWKKLKNGLELKQFDIDKRELIDGD